MNDHIIPNLSRKKSRRNNNRQKFYFCFAVCLSLLGVIIFLLTKDIAVVTAMNLPLVTLIAHMKGKK
jgi:hypothetical protein